MKSRSGRWSLFLVLFQAGLAFNCSQRAPDNPETSTKDISISITPSTSVVALNQSLQFSAQVTGVSSPDVTWGILNPSPAKGTIDSNGL
jgi:hypothetical protein